LTDVAQQTLFGKGGGFEKVFNAVGAKRRGGVHVRCGRRVLRGGKETWCGLKLVSEIVWISISHYIGEVGRTPRGTQGGVWVERVVRRSNARSCFGCDGFRDFPLRLPLGARTMN
jgi:hypothetical protein